jgi:ubiquinone biosynthesis protein Coq4
LLVGAADDEIAERLASLGDCPPGSLGRSFHDFYERNGFPPPVGHLSLVSHDFAHVLAGYDATPEGELALQAMLVAGTGGTRHFPGLLASLLLFEVGMMPFPDIEPKVAVLDRPGAAELFADAIGRGAASGCDLQHLDHLELADRDLVALRVELGVPAPVPGPSTFVV